MVIAQRTTRTVTGIALLAALAACGDDGSAPDTSGKPAADTDRTYVVTGVTEKGAPKDLVKGTEIRLRFEGDTLTLTAGCNTMSGAFTLDGTRLTVEQMSMTEMGCDPPRMDQDSWLAGLFEKPVQFTDGGTGAVISGDTVLAITDRETVSPDKPLVGTTWVLDTTFENGGDGVASSVPASAKATLTLEGSGDFTAQYGCGSTLSGTVDEKGESLTWSVTASGIADCVRPYPGSDEAGAAMQEVLDGETTFRIEENTLTITHGDRGLGFHAAATG